jgi:cytochrome c peroxidase
MRRTLATISLGLLLGCPADETASGSGGKGKPAYQDKNAKGKPVKPSDVEAPTKADAKGDEGGDTKEPSAEGGAEPDASAWAWTLPKGINTPPVVPADNPMTAEKVELGHKLFMDKRLSVDGSRSCYSCHQNHLGNADGREKALGPGKKLLERNSPTIWNVGLHTSLYWEGRAANLEAQGVGALKGGNMGLGDGLEAKAAEIGELPEYKDAFKTIFGLADGDKVTSEHVAKALSAYQRTLLCGDTAFDKGELAEAAERGKQLFLGKAACFGCHTGDNLSDGRFHVTGVGVDPKKKDADVGRFKVSEVEAEKFAFRTPTLRNVARTAPYFHDGSVKTLKEAVKTMAGGGKPREGLTLDQMLRDVKLTDAEIDDLVAFLEALDCPGTLEEIGDQKAEGIEPPKG